MSKLPRHAAAPLERLAPEAKILVAGAGGMVGAALVRQLRAAGHTQLLTPRRAELDFTDAVAVNHYFAAYRPDYVLLAAAKVGGIHANNTYPAEFIRDNLAMALNVITASHQVGVQRLLFLGSSCIYPKLAPQPLREEYLLIGALEPTNEPYALAKIAGIKLCESFNRQYQTDYRAVMPTNLYGPRDNFHLQDSHVIPALLRKFHEAKQAGATEVEVWGTGLVRREFLHVDDLAAACLFVLRLPKTVYGQVTQPMCAHLNIGIGEDISIRELAELVRHVTGFAGVIRYNADKPEGTPRKWLEVSKLKQLGWQAQIELRRGLADTYAWFCTHEAETRR